MEVYNETVIDHENGMEVCSVSSGDKKVKNRLHALHEKYPDYVVPMALNKDGSVWYHVPWSWIRIQPPNTINMTEEERLRLSERMRKMSKTLHGT